MRRVIQIACACMVLFSGGKGFAQEDRPPIIPTPQGEGQEGQQQHHSGSLASLFEKIKEADPILQAGLKAGLLRQAQQVLPFVVVVNNPGSYLYAISQWESMVRFPILWDDGSVESRENIARFVRAYKPDRVLELRERNGWTLGQGFDERGSQIDRALAMALNEQATDWRPVLESIRTQGVVSPGIVLTDPTEQAWAGALALAAGRFQPIGYMERPARIHEQLDPEQATRIEVQLQLLARSTNRTWNTLGDEIDAITLAMNTGTQIKTGSGARDRLALTDRLGRREVTGKGQRWAYCGQLIGNEAQSVYRAMCALFLEIDQAFIWDGYPASQPWSAYDGTEASKTLEEAGMSVELHDLPRNGIENWYLRQVRPIGSAEGEPGSSLMILMNSKGSNKRFDLDGGRQEEGYAGDMPMLAAPAIMHIVHSFSAQLPHNRNTIAARLLERGVFAYTGSVDEPFLGGFVPTPEVARRFSAGVPFAAAVRYTERDAWKITVLGDPLITPGSGGRRIEASLDIDSLIDLSERVKERVKEQDFAGALRDLVVLGRDKDAARLASALLSQKPENFRPDAALIAMPALQRSGEFIAMIDCFEHLDTKGRTNGIMQDLLWLVSPYVLARAEQDPSLRARVEALLRGSLRAGQKINDAERLAMQLRKTSLSAALGVLEGLRADMNENQRRELDRAIDRVKR
jgi:hypothetical protein